MKCGVWLLNLHQASVTSNLTLKSVLIFPPNRALLPVTALQRGLGVEATEWSGQRSSLDPPESLKKITALDSKKLSVIP